MSILLKKIIIKEKTKVVKTRPTRPFQPEKQGTGPGTGPVEPEKSGKAKNRDKTGHPPVEPVNPTYPLDKTSHYILKFIGFTLIYYSINLNIIL